MNVKIYKPSKNAMQSGRAKTEKWILEFKSTSRKTPESLMGWSSSNDTLSQVKLKFDTCAQAIAYANKNGWTYELSSERKRKVKPRNYTDNFVYRPEGDE